MSYLSVSEREQLHHPFSDPYCALARSLSSSLHPHKLDAPLVPREKVCQEKSVSKEGGQQMTRYTLTHRERRSSSTDTTVGLLEAQVRKRGKSEQQIQRSSSSYTFLLGLFFLLFTFFLFLYSSPASFCYSHNQRKKKARISEE